MQILLHSPWGRWISPAVPVRHRRRRYRRRCRCRCRRRCRCCCCCCCCCCVVTLAAVLMCCLSCCKRSSSPALRESKRAGRSDSIGIATGSRDGGGFSRARCYSRHIYIYRALDRRAGWRAFCFALQDYLSIYLSICRSVCTKTTCGQQFRHPLTDLSRWPRTALTDIYVHTYMSNNMVVSIDYTAVMYVCVYAVCICPPHACMWTGRMGVGVGVGAGPHFAGDGEARALCAALRCVAAAAAAAVAPQRRSAGRVCLFRICKPVWAAARGT